MQASVLGLVTLPGHRGACCMLLGLRAVGFQGLHTCRISCIYKQCTHLHMYDNIRFLYTYIYISTKELGLRDMGFRGVQKVKRPFARIIAT